MTINDYTKKRQMPIGADIIENGVHFRVWAPQANQVTLLLGKEKNQPIYMEKEDSGYFSAFAFAKENEYYNYRLDESPNLSPDPASRYQPLGPFGPSQIINPFRYVWSDHHWQGINKEKAIIYELHIGTFTQEGTWASAREKLPYLANLGITVIEMMPIAEFPGRFGWGYDGVNLFAPMHTYGSPDDLRSFIDCAHQLNIGVILDVVYNHLGPGGDYIKQFSSLYFSTEYVTDWGPAINFNKATALPVREFFIQNAGYWIEEFHFDGLRFDATQNIYDDEKTHILQEISSFCRKKAKTKTIYLTAENEPQNNKNLLSVEDGGYGLDALWNDDFHHTASVLLTGKREAYYCDYRGSPQEFISGMKYSFLFQGQWNKWQNKNRGTSTANIDRYRFINFLQNHDQIANSCLGARIHTLTHPGLLRAMTAFLLLSPQTPLLFQGQEFGASNTFNYFTDLDNGLASAVSLGRLKFLEQFASFLDRENSYFYPNPLAEATFQSCKLDFSECEKNKFHFKLHQDLIQLRKKDPVFSAPTKEVEGAVLNEHIFLMRMDWQQDVRLLLVNTGPGFTLDAIPEPLLVPPLGSQWQIYWSSENPHYGGKGTLPHSSKMWHLPSHSLLVFKPTFL